MATGHKILVLEDNTNLRETLCDVLEAKGYAPISVATGKEALGYIKNESLSVALIDLKLADMSGTDVMRGIKKVSPDTECIVLTGHASQEAAIEAVNLGAYSFIEKPYKMDQLLLTVRRAIEKRDADKALRESEARFRTIFEQAAVGVALVESKTGRFRRINRGYCKMIGYPAEVMLKDKTFQEITHPEDLPADLENMARLRAGEIREFSMEKRYFHKNGSIVWVDLTVSAGWSIGEEPEYHIAVVQDITERKRTEEALKEREAQLRRAAKMEAIGTLTGGIAHDFNNILQSLLGFCALAQDRGLDDRDLLTECLHEIEVGGRRAADMVAQLLTFSRVEEVERKLCRVEPVVREALAFMRASLSATIEIQTEFADDCYPVFADATQIHQIVVNLCANASHAMAKDGGILLVEVRKLSLTQATVLSSGSLEAGEYVILVVKDSGCGIAPDDLDRLFEPFFTTRRAQGGSGLGLSTVHGIVQSMDGGIDVVSKPGEGALFKVFLPRHRGGETKQTPTSAPTDRRRTGSVRVLFVDDETAIAKMIALTLENRGYAVDTFTNPAEAIEAFQGDPDSYDIVITDMTMPRINGIELSIRVHSINAKVPILLATGQLKIDALAPNEISEVIRKPFDVDRLVESIERHVGLPQDLST